MVSISHEIQVRDLNDVSRIEQLASKGQGLHIVSILVVWALTLRRLVLRPLHPMISNF